MFFTYANKQWLREVMLGSNLQMKQNNDFPSVERITIVLDVSFPKK